MAARPSGHKAAVGMTDDLAEMEDLDQPALLAELQARFKRDVIYTYVGEILVSVNPFKMIDGLYSAEKMSQYRSVVDKGMLQPHVFATASMAYQDMIGNKSNQVCVISGESGAGKTEAAKRFVQQLVNVSQGAEYEGLEEKLLELNPVLEAFGNAKTKFNNNSSRFGKYTSIVFNSKGQVKGAEMIEYLLEKSRVTGQGEDEQNFHIFYLFFQGLKDNADYQAGDIADHTYLMGNDEACDYAMAGPGGGGFAVTHPELIKCFEVVGFTQDMQDDIFHTLSGIVSLGDIEFTGPGGDEDGDAQLSAESKDPISVVCHQLGLDEHTLEEAFTVEHLKLPGGEEVERKLQVPKAEDVRDATAKVLYEKLFSWIVKTCNDQLTSSKVRPAGDDVRMGILDIFGFENFEHNSLEQMCINLTNEQLQWYFNEFIFAMEEKDYTAEGIDFSQIQYDKNEPLLDLIMYTEGKAINGLFGVLDEQAWVPKATDTTLIMKFHEMGKSHKDYDRPKSNENKFTLVHYAGRVEYTADGLDPTSDAGGFLYKNRDTLAVDVVGALRISENELVKLLFGGEKGGKGGGRGKKRGKVEAKGRMRQSIKHARASIAKKAKKTLASGFKASLLSLKENLLSSQPHFIRTVKPNHEKTDGLFDARMEATDGEDGLVMRQLSYTGMLETIRIRKQGYPSRPKFKDFVYRYKVLGFPCRAQVAPTAESCRQILSRAGVDEYQVGKTKVFLKDKHAGELNAAMAPFSEAAAMLSKYCRGFAARAKYGELVAAKRAQDAEIASFCNKIERDGAGCRDVIESLCEEDAEKHPRVFDAVPALPKKKSKKKGGRMNRAASVKWFKEEQADQVTEDDGGFADWFHGIITRHDAEGLLKGQKSGTFLIRVAESRFGYSLSLMFNGRCKHFMIDQNDQDRYLVVGNDRTFPSLNEVVAFHSKHPVTDDGDTLTAACPVTGPRADLAELQ